MTAADAPSAVFRGDGDVWKLHYAGRSVVLKHAKGLQDLHRLLSAPGAEVSAAELAGQSHQERAAAEAVGPGDVSWAVEEREDSLTRRRVTR